MDFETYARTKSMIGKVDPVWHSIFYRCFEKTSVSKDALQFLDFGCGDGRYYSYLLNEGFPGVGLYGVEASRIRVERCIEKGWSQVHYVEPGASLPFPDRSFDIISMVEVIEHIPEATLGLVMSEIGRVLKPGGFLIATTPNYPAKRFYDVYIAVRFFKWKRFKDDPTHVSQYNPKKLRAALEGFVGKTEIVSYRKGFLYSWFKQECFLHKIAGVAQKSGGAI